MTTPTATIFVPYHALDDVILRGPRASQPAASAVVPGTLYCVTDEGAVVERSSGTTWERYGVRRPSSLAVYDFSDTTTPPPVLNQLRINAAPPYTTATRLYVRFTSNDGMDIYWRLLVMPVDTRLYLQDKNDHTIYVRFRTTAPALDQATYMELAVVWEAGSGPTFVNNQAVVLLELG
jgi:hypothetical protein